MFENLVESTSHKEEFKRKGSFIAATAILMTLTLGILFVVGIQMANAEIDSQELQLETMLAPVPIPQQVQQKEAPKPAAKVEDKQVATRTELVARVDQPVAPKEIVTTKQTVPPVPKGVAYTQGTSNTEATVTGGPIGTGSGPGVPGGTGGGNAGPAVNMDPPPPPPPKPSPPPPPKPSAPISGGVLNGKAISLPTPPYPPIAKQAHASGTVTVQVTIDENGNVISARAVSGHPLLQAAAVGAARGARFSPTKLSGQPVKVTGVITYNFVAQ